VVVPTEETWQLIERWIPTAADAGFRFDLADLLIAGVTNELGGLVWSLDSDFQAMEKLGFAHLYG
jgi:predicted nucleic acid-binding protein